MCHMFQHVIGNKITETHLSVITVWRGYVGPSVIGIPGNTKWEVGCDLHTRQWSWKDKIPLSLHVYRKLWFQLVFSIWRDFGLPNLYIKIFLAMDEKRQKKPGVQTSDFSVLSPPTVFDRWEALTIYRHLLLLHTHLKGCPHLQGAFSWNSEPTGTRAPENLCLQQYNYFNFYFSCLERITMIWCKGRFLAISI